MALAAVFTLLVYVAQKLLADTEAVGLKIWFTQLLRGQSGALVGVGALLETAGAEDGDEALVVLEASFVGAGAEDDLGGAAEDWTGAEDDLGGATEDWTGAAEELGGGTGLLPPPIWLFLQVLPHLW